jgi:hypothetical protein
VDVSPDAFAFPKKNDRPERTVVDGFFIYGEWGRNGSGTDPV